MPISRAVLERQIDLANKDIAACVEQLKKNGVAQADFRKSAKWRTLNAKANQIQRRLNSLAKVEANNAEVERRKAEAGSAAE